MKKPQKLGLKKNFKTNICVIGVGYVGLPLVINLAKSYKVTAYDKNYSRIKELQNGYDRNLDLDKRKIINKEIKFTNNYNDIIKINTEFWEYQEIYQLYFSLLNVHLWDREYINDAARLAKKFT